MSDPLKTAVNDYFAQKERGLNIHFDDLAPATSLTGPPARRYLSAIPVAAALAAIMVGTTMISFDPWEDPSPADIAAEPVGLCTCNYQRLHAGTRTPIICSHTPGVSDGVRPRI